MKRFRYYILPRVCLALSVLVLLSGLWVLWLSLGRPMPTIALACRQAETASLLPHGRIAARGSIRYQVTTWRPEAWLARRYGDDVRVYSFSRVYGVFWEEPWLEFYAPDSDFVAFPADATLISISERSYAVTPMAVCDLPDAARLEADVIWLGDWEDDPAAAVAERGVTAELTHAGDCIWVGPALSISGPDDPGGSIVDGSVIVCCRAYDADGNLLAVYDPTAG